jgi:flagellar biosynthesis protein FliQ
MLTKTWGKTLSFVPRVVNHVPQICLMDIYMHSEKVTDVEMVLNDRHQH